MAKLKSTIKKAVKNRRNIKRYLTDYKYRFNANNNCGLYDFLPDKLFLKLCYRAKTGKRLNLKNPQTLNEKMQWLKLYNRNPLYTTMVDKLSAKKYVADIIGEQYIIPAIGEWNTPEEIDYSLLPQKFVLKCNHNSGTGMYVCTDKSKIDIKSVNAALSKGLKQNFYKRYREWPYKNVKRKIFAEKYMENTAGEPLTDYKFFCIDGEPVLMYISKDYNKDARADTFDMDFNLLETFNPSAGELPAKPKHFEKMIELAEKLSSNIPFVRVDFYYIDEKIYFGEMTFFHYGGFVPVESDEMDREYGEMIVLPKKRIK